MLCVGMSAFLHTPGTRNKTQEEPQPLVLELSGRPWQVYSCYDQCPKPGLCPRLGDSLGSWAWGEAVE